MTMLSKRWLSTTRAVLDDIATATYTDTVAGTLATKAVDPGACAALTAEQQTAVIAVIQLGTLAAVFVYFARDIWNICYAFVRDHLLLLRGRGGSARFAPCRTSIAAGFHHCDGSRGFDAVAGRLCYACAVAEYFTKIGPPGVVDEIGIGAETLEQALHVLGVRAKFLGDHL